MQFRLTDEQRDLRALAREFFAAAAPPAVARARLDAADQYRPAVWRSMAGLGLPGIGVDERHGGSGGGMVELAVLMEEAGRALLVEPLLANTVLAAGALRHSGGDAAARHLPALASGATIGTVALPDNSEFHATATADGWAVTGTATSVIDGGADGLILVPARTDRGMSLFAVASDAPTLRRTALPVLDRTRSLTALRLDAVPAELVGTDGRAGAVLDRVLDEAAIALAAEQVGGAQACLEMAVGYARTRVAFGREIGSFQAVKHKCASLYLDIEAARAAVQFAASAVDACAPDVSLPAATTAADCADVFVRAAEENIQIHGGIGFTWEHDAHLYLRRARSGRELLRSPARHREHAARLLGI